MTKTVHSVCPLDCPDRCTLHVDVDGDRVVRIDGSSLNRWTDGYICAKVRHFGERLTASHRLTRPMRRVGPKGPGSRFEPVSWDDALDEIVARWQVILREDGPAALLPAWYAGSNGMLTGRALDQRLWNRLGTSQVERTLCAANTGAGAKMTFGATPSLDVAKVEQAEAAVLWGCNPSASGIHLVPRMRDLMRRGGRLAVVDPRRTPLAAQATLHVAPLPGTDVALALGVARAAAKAGLAKPHPSIRDLDRYLEAIEEWTPERTAAMCGIGASEVVALAEFWTQGPVWLRAGWGLERTRNGTDSVRAVLGLSAFMGDVGTATGGWSLSTSSGYGMDLAPLMRAPGWPEVPRIVNLAQLGRALLTLRDPPIRSVYIYDLNPVATIPDQASVVAGLADPDRFVVVHEQVYTDTCDYADILLPATTFLEHRELSRSYAGYGLMWSEAAVPPAGEARNNHDVIQALARRLGITDPELYEDELTYARSVVRTWPGSDEGTFDRLRRDGHIPVVGPSQLPEEVWLCRPEAPKTRPPPEEAHRRFIVVSPAIGAGISSTMLEDTPGRLRMHPDDAASCRLSTGQRAEVTNGRGTVVIDVVVSDQLRRGVVEIPKGLWRRSTRNGWTSNVLIPDHVDELGGGACYNDARVDIRPFVPEATSAVA